MQNNLFLWPDSPKFENGITYSKSFDVISISFKQNKLKPSNDNKSCQFLDSAVWYVGSKQGNIEKACDQSHLLDFSKYEKLKKLEIVKYQIN